jgi:hypothetical protein
MEMTILYFFPSGMLPRDMGYLCAVRGLPLRRPGRPSLQQTLIKSSSECQEGPSLPTVTVYYISKNMRMRHGWDEALFV